jgi:enoyl-CoA hydratase
MGVLLIGIDRVDAQNRIDIPTFSALGQAYYEFEHDEDLRVAVLYGKGPDFSRGLDLPSWGAGLRAGPFQAPPNFLDPLGTTGPERSKPLVVAVQGHVTRIAHELFLAADVRVAARDAVFNQGEVTARRFREAAAPFASFATPDGEMRCATCSQARTGMPMKPTAWDSCKS